MAVSSSSMAQLTRRGVKPKEADLNDDAKMRRKYGIAPKGKPPKGGWPDSAYGFPVPPKGHPQALRYARAVLSRAHQSKKYTQADLQKQVRKAQAIVKAHNKGYAPSKSASAMAKGVKESRVTPNRLRESLRFEGVLREADAEKGTARVIIICAGAGNAADKHYYTPECLEDAVERKVFEGKQCYLDHPSKLEDQIIPERMVEKLAGWFSDCEMARTENDQGVTVPCIEATFVPEPGNEVVFTKLRAAQQYGKQFNGEPYIGFSINAAGVGAPAEIDGQQYNRVDRITEAVSIDMVTRAGAGGKLLMLKESQRKAIVMKKGLKVNLVRSVKGAIKEAGIGLSEEQDEALDKALGIEDGGALDNLLDQVTMGGAAGADGSDPDEGDLGEDGLDGAGDADEQPDDADDAGDDAGSGAGAGDDDEDIESMDESDLKAALRAARKKEREAQKAAEKASKEAKEARREANRAKITAQGIVRERARASIFEDLKIPASHRPILERHMRQDTTAKEMRETAVAYAKANHFGGESVAPGGADPKPAQFKIDCLAD